MNNYQNLCFDYGGTLDTGGIHWADFLWQEYQKHHVPVTHEAFCQAYVHTERYMGQHDVIHSEHTFHETLSIKVQMQLHKLLSEEQLHMKDENDVAEPIVTSSYQRVLAVLDHARPILQSLAKNHTLVLVSNFYGNLHTVLREFHLDTYFKDVVESAAVGIRKPDSAIYQLALNRNHLRSENTLVIGDSLKNDIFPAHSLGIHTVWLAPFSTDVHPEVNYHISDLKELLIINNS